jgi:drug/metabolite transporter (DMT)-like permease
MFLPFGFYDAVGFDSSGVPILGWAAILYFGVGVSVLAFVVWFSAVSQVPASTAAVFSGVLPISAVCLSYLVLGEQLGWAHLLGVVFVLGGIGLIAKRQPAAPERSLAAEEAD